MDCNRPSCRTSLRHQILYTFDLPSVSGVELFLSVGDYVYEILGIVYTRQVKHSFHDKDVIFHKFLERFRGKSVLTAKTAVSPQQYVMLKNKKIWLGIISQIVLCQNMSLLVERCFVDNSCFSSSIHYHTDTPQPVVHQFLRVKSYVFRALCHLYLAT